VTGFAADWLALREPYDQRARNPAVLDALASAVAHFSSIAVVDLACGTGATLRAISTRLPSRQSWRLIDNDLGLLARAADLAFRANIAATANAVDLARDLEAALDGPIDLVTTSAFLDLVSADWLERFVIELAARRLPLYAALSYDGRALLAPEDPHDRAIIAAVNRHQLIDKGFGPALGPGASARALARLEVVGYRVVYGTSDWHLAPHDREIQEKTLAGWAGAARELGDLSLATVASWLTRRRDLIATGRSTIRVGHVDFFARPIAMRWAERSQSSSSSSSST
jgi:hypothetical protein